MSRGIAKAAAYKWRPLQTLFNRDGPVRRHCDTHAVLDVVQEFLAQFVNNGHRSVRPNLGEYGSARSQRVYGLGEEQAGWLLVAQAV